MKNKKLIILNSVSLGLAVLAVLCMMAFPVEEGITLFSFGQGLVGSSAEYAIMGMFFTGATYFLIGIVVFFVLGLLNACGIIKKAKGFYITNIVLSSVALVCALYASMLFIAEEVSILQMNLTVLISVALIVLSAVTLHHHKKAVKALAEKPVEAVATEAKE